MPSILTPPTIPPDGQTYVRGKLVRQTDELKQNQTRSRNRQRQHPGQTATAHKRAPRRGLGPLALPPFLSVHRHRYDDVPENMLMCLNDGT